MSTYVTKPNEGPSIKYVTLFLTIFTPLPPVTNCHKTCLFHSDQVTDHLLLFTMIIKLSLSSLWICGESNWGVHISGSVTWFPYCFMSHLNWRMALLMRPRQSLFNNAANQMTSLWRL